MPSENELLRLFSLAEENRREFDISAWNPRETLDIDLRIAADGSWHHQNAPINRPRMVKFFASLLRRENVGENKKSREKYALITPHLKYPVKVEEAPFLAVELRRRGGGKNQELFFRTNVDDVARADADHPISAANFSGVPEIEIRAGLRAKLSRAVWLELADLLIPSEKDAGVLGVYSAGSFFAVGGPE
ncbi:MAG: DUF1285 domain-containing protein [Gammaproteobacteria bacterium]